jgi:hypothetical protein
VGHSERRRERERQFPGWEIWYVPREPDGATWNFQSGWTRGRNWQPALSPANVGGTRGLTETDQGRSIVSGPVIMGGAFRSFAATR